MNEILNDMESRKQQFLGFVIILLIVGFLNYFRRIANGLKLTKSGKILYLSTMVVFVIGVMFVLYYSNLNNILSFILGLLVTNLSEHIAKFFIILGNNFNPILIKIVKKIFKIDLSVELTDDEIPRK